MTMDKMPTPTGGSKKMWAMRLSKEELSKLADIRRVTKATRTAFFRWCINTYHAEHVMGDTSASKAGMNKRSSKR